MVSSIRTHIYQDHTVQLSLAKIESLESSTSSDSSSSSSSSPSLTSGSRSSSSVQQTFYTKETDLWFERADAERNASELESISKTLLETGKLIQALEKNNSDISIFASTGLMFWQSFKRAEAIMKRTFLTPRYIQAKNACNAIYKCYQNEFNSSLDRFHRFTLQLADKFQEKIIKDSNSNVTELSDVLTENINVLLKIMPTLASHGAIVEMNHFLAKYQGYIESESSIPSLISRNSELFKDPCDYKYPYSTS